MTMRHRAPSQWPPPRPMAVNPVILTVVTDSFLLRDWRAARPVVGNVVDPDVDQLRVDLRVVVAAQCLIQESAAMTIWHRVPFQCRVILIAVTVSSLHRDWRAVQQNVDSVVGPDAVDFPVDHRIAVEALLRVQGYTAMTMWHRASFRVSVRSDLSGSSRTCTIWVEAVLLRPSG